MHEVCKKQKENINDGFFFFFFFLFGVRGEKQAKKRKKEKRNSITTIVRLPFWQHNTHAYLIEDFRYTGSNLYIYGYYIYYLGIYRVAGDKRYNDDIGQPSGRQKTRQNCSATQRWAAKAIGGLSRAIDLSIQTVVFLSTDWFAWGGALNDIRYRHRVVGTLLKEYSLYSSRLVLISTCTHFSCPSWVQPLGNTEGRHICKRKGSQFSSSMNWILAYAHAYQCFILENETETKFNLICHKLEIYERYAKRRFIGIKIWVLSLTMIRGLNVFFFYWNYSYR